MWFSRYLLGSQSKSMTITFGATLYNENQNVPNLIELVLNVLQQFPSDHFVLVDNGSTDNTFIQLSSAFESNQSVKLLKNENSRGYGDGIRRLLSEVPTEKLLTFPADFQFEIPEIIKLRRFWEIEGRKKSHLNILSVRERHDGLYQGMRGKIWRLILCLMFRISLRYDPASQLRVLCVDCIGELEADDFTIDIEILKKLKSNQMSGQLSTYKSKFTSRSVGKSSIDKGLLVTEFRVVQACIRLKKKLK